jgi:hypothetical protein
MLRTVPVATDMAVGRAHVRESPVRSGPGDPFIPYGPTMEKARVGWAVAVLVLMLAMLPSLGWQRSSWAMEPVGSSTSSRRAPPTKRRPQDRT